ncbi:putative [histone H3]-lysine-36 demethylase [Rosa chinensis]|uniref:Putative [histone H3]-lysine-36 demethylase n=1 Tax=Rosa chinensis TaxID=74649 RepID=A0A2P6QM71_ROSCH|nr:putative [histone H3]-lysine-36 demethylase [Rosa chinensis]
MRLQSPQKPALTFFHSEVKNHLTCGSQNLALRLFTSASVRKPPATVRLGLLPSLLQVQFFTLPSNPLSQNAKQKNTLFGTNIHTVAARQHGLTRRRREMAWEQLHSGPWHSVLPVWRDADAMACLHVAKLHFAAAEFTDALRALDMGLLMGGPIFKSDLHSAMTKVPAKSRAAARVPEQNGPNLDRRLVRDDLKATEMLEFCLQN